MRNICLLLVATALLFAACKTNNKPTADTTTAQTTDMPCQTGDLLFVSLPLSYGLGLSADSVDIVMSQIDAPTQCIHVAIIERQEDSIFIIDATAKRGVARYPLADFLADFTLPNGGLPILQLMRLKDNSEAEHFIANAKQYIGQPYDTDFTLGNNAQYCSELVRNSFVTTAGDTLFPTLPIDFTEGRETLSRYWGELFALLKCTNPQGNIGLMPHDIMHDTLLQAIGTLPTSAE
ncbi:MAG: hypothetical protein II793_01310 [Bacteroidales bacterium]|nr:hypothetical protein [Bacteroidales bacterium]